MWGRGLSVKWSLGTVKRKVNVSTRQTVTGSRRGVEGEESKLTFLDIVCVPVYNELKKKGVLGCLRTQRNFIREINTVTVTEWFILRSRVSHTGSVPRLP